MTSPIQSAPHEFKSGDRVRVASSGVHEGWRRGEFTIAKALPDGRYRLASEDSALKAACAVTAWARDELRPASPPAAEPMVEMYDVQPETLLLVLPPGTRWRQGGKSGAFHEPAALSVMHATYRGGSSCEKGSPFEAVILAENIDWTTVPKPAPPAGKTSTGFSWRCRSCRRVMNTVGSAASSEAAFVCGECASKPSEPARPDREEMAARDAQVARSQATRDADYRKRVAALTLDMDRPLPPRTWPDKMGKLCNWTGPVRRR